ncbi:mucin-2-like [Sycon ciliatum]|uniref:mucin-2-like n=1 Tax=Sycon ciliatum TaxID=27933 RepID=UPI0031F70E04
MKFPIVLFLFGLCFPIYGGQTCNRRQCFLEGFYQEQTRSIKTVGVLYYSASTKLHSKWREVIKGQRVSANFEPTTSCNMVVRYVNFYIKGGSSCQTDIQIIRGSKKKTWRHVSKCGLKSTDCLRWHVLDKLSSNLRQQCPEPSKVSVFIKPLERAGTFYPCHVSADKYLTIIRLFMEYTTEEERTTLAPITRRPVSTTVKTRPTTSKYIIPTDPGDTTISPTFVTTDHAIQPTEVQATIGNWSVTPSYEKPDSVQSQSTVPTASSTMASAESHISNTTEEEPTTLAPTARRPVPTTVKPRPTTSNYVTSTKPRDTPISPTSFTTEHDTQPASMFHTTIGNLSVTASDEKPDSVQSQSTAPTISPTTSSAESHISSSSRAETDEDAITMTQEATTPAPLPTIQSTSASLIAESTNYIWIIGVVTGSIQTVILIALLFVFLYKKCRRTSAQVHLTNTRDHGSDHGSEPPTQGLSNPDYSYTDLRGNASDPTRSAYSCANPDRDYPTNQQGALEVQYTNTTPHGSNNLVPQKPKTSNAEEEYSVAGAATDHRNQSLQEDAEHASYTCPEESSILDLEQRPDSTYDELRYASQEWSTLGDARQKGYSDAEEIDHWTNHNRQSLHTTNYAIPRVGRHVRPVGSHFHIYILVKTKLPTKTSCRNRTLCTTIYRRTKEARISALSQTYRNRTMTMLTWILHCLTGTATNQASRVIQ